MQPEPPACAKRRGTRPPALCLLFCLTVGVAGFGQTTTAPAQAPTTPVQNAPAKPADAGASEPKKTSLPEPQNTLPYILDLVGKAFWPAVVAGALLGWRKQIGRLLDRVHSVELAGVKVEVLPVESMADPDEVSAREIPLKFVDLANLLRRK